MKYAIAIFAVTLLLCAGWAYQFMWGRPAQFNRFVERVSLRWALDDPELLSYLGIVENGWLDFHSGKLTDISYQQNEKSLKFARDSLDILHQYKRDELALQAKLTYDILERYLQDILDEAVFNGGSNIISVNTGPYPVNQLFGIQNGLPSFMVDVHRVVNKKSAKNYIARLSQWDKKFADLMDALKLLESNGVLPPRFVIEKVLVDLREFVSTPPAESVLYTSFRDKVEKVDISKSDKDRLEQSAICEIRDTVYPSYEKLIVFLEDQKERATSDAGVWKFPNGGAYYAHCLKCQTTTDYSPEAIHELGRSEVARIQDEMRGIVNALGYEGRDPIEVIAMLGQDPQFLYPDTEEGRKEIMEDFRAILKNTESLFASLFIHVPAAELKLEQVPAFKAKTSPAAYYEPGDLSGNRPGTFFVNVHDLKGHPKFSMPVLAYHEGIPGHHFQISIAQEIKNLPVFRRIVPFNAYLEGWALYCERLAWEFGGLPDAYSNLGRLQMELMRAVRLVVDTGIHHKRWSRDKAIAYMIENTGMNENAVIIEIERYIVLPGQACSYKIGMIKILELREKMKKRLGNAFDIRQFHEIVLQNGAMPLDLLEKHLDEAVSSLAR